MTRTRYKEKILALVEDAVNDLPIEESLQLLVELRDRFSQWAIKGKTQGSQDNQQSEDVIKT